MQRLEKNNRFLHLLVILLLVISPILIPIRLSFVTEYMSVAGVHSIMDMEDPPICDREGNVITDDYDNIPQSVGNLIGSRLIENSIIGKLSNLLYATNGRVSFLRGYRALPEEKLRSLTTTLLPVSSQNRLYESLEGYNGEIVAYNYKTGEVYCAISSPSSAFATGEDDGNPMLNRAVNSLVDSFGSTMKIPTVIMAYDQGIDLENFRYTCTGSRILADGSEIDCISNVSHGENLTIKDIIQKSCNCGMSALVEKFDTEKTKELLLQMGFDLRNFDTGEPGVKDKPKHSKEFLNRTLARYYSEIQVGDFSSYEGAWTFIGQGKTMMSPIHFCMVAGAVSNGGKAAEPVYVNKVTSLDRSTVYKDYTDSGVFVRIFSKDAAEYVRNQWMDATYDGYRQYFDSDVVTMCKTGTSQNTGDVADRALLLVMEGYDTAVYIGAQNAGQGNNICFRVANVLIREMSANFGAPHS